MVELSSDGDSFTGDAIFLPQINGDSFEKKMAQARKYWSGKLKGELVETLLGGKIKVERIVEEYSE